jgi:multiple sugar transport system permease protein
LSQKQVWGLLFTAPYIAVFLGFVVFPVGYAFWLARSPHLYVELSEDPIFLRTVINTLVFLIVAINIKMVMALFLSGFFAQKRWWVKVLAVLFVLPWAVPSIPDHPVDPLHAQSRMGRDQHADLQADGR